MLTMRMITLLVLAVLIAPFFTGCGSGSSESPAILMEAGNTPTVTPTATTLTGNTIMLTGGGGPNVGIGGAGGVWNIETYSVKGVSMKLSGIAPAAFTVPAYNPVPDFGANPVTVTTNMIVMLLNTGDPDPGAGVLYEVSTVDGDMNLYEGSGSGTVPDVSDIVTGLRVNAGVTLTLVLNWDSNNVDLDSSSVTGQDMTTLNFSNDVELLGKVTTMPLTTATGTVDQRRGAPATSRDMGSMNIMAAQIFVRPGGSCNTAGLLATAGSNTRGGDGGLLGLAANNFAINEGTLDASGGMGDNTGTGGNGGAVLLAAMYGTGGGNGGGVVVNKGKLLVSGGEGAGGGSGGVAYLSSSSHIFNTGVVNASGGRGTSGPGGSCLFDLSGIQSTGGVSFSSQCGSVFNSGALTAKGGDGITGGGTGGLVTLTGPVLAYEGDAANTGVLNVSGGNALTAGNGGDSGDIYIGGFGGAGGFRVYGSIRNSGSLIANGGDSQGPGNGGNAGAITLWNAAGKDYALGKYTPLKPIQLSGNIGLRGGTSYSGGNGGIGGTLTIKQDLSPAGDLSQGGIQLMGYAKADLSGGSGVVQGGSASSNAMTVYTYADAGEVANYPGAYTYLPVGPIYNELAIIARGGGATFVPSQGGSGGYLAWRTRSSPTGSITDSWASTGTSAITNKGMIDLSGGSGGEGGGGNSGGLNWYGHDGVTNSGAILNKGGNSTGGTGGMGCGYEVALLASLDVVNTGAITATGGSGLNGGDIPPSSMMAVGPAHPSGQVRMYAGGQVRNSGNILVNGGAATTGTSGDGGLVDIMSESRPTQNTAPLISVARGATTLGKHGQNGEIWIDWVDVTPLDGTRP